MKKKKIIGIAILIVVISALLAAGIRLFMVGKNIIETGNVFGISWYNTTDKEFTLSSAKQVQEFAKLSDVYSFEGQTIKLGADIVLNEGNATEWEETAPENLWTPISGFAGTFDGQGHSISGLYARAFEAPTAMFVNTSQKCTIQNVKLVNSYIEAKNYTGTASFLANGGGTLKQLYSDAIINCKGENAGGIASRITVQSVFEECWYDGVINITERDCGGIVDQITEVRAELKHCLFSGTINSEYDFGGTKTGGLIGIVEKASGVVIQDCLVSGKVNAAKDVYTGALIGVSYTGTAVSTTNSYVSSDSYSSLIGQPGANGTFTGRALTMQEEFLEGIRGYQWTTLDFENYWAAVEEDTPVLKCFAGDGVSLAGVEKKYDISWYNSGVYKYELTTKEQLYGLYILSSGNNFAERRITLGADIVINEGDATKWAAGETIPSNPWFPIGSSEVPFAGVLDGNGHTISGIYLNTSAANAGLFGVTATGSTVQNLKLTNSYFCGKADNGSFAGMGSIAGQLRGNLNNVYSNAIVESNGENIGGLVGSANGVKVNDKYTTVTLSNCWFDGEVRLKEQSGRYGGGIAGVAMQGEVNIEHCLFSGIVSSEAVNTGLHVGGFFGTNKNTVYLKMKDCLSSGQMKVDYDVCVGSSAGRLQVEGSTFAFENVYATKECYQTKGGTAIAVGLVSSVEPKGNTILLAEELLKGTSAYQLTELDFANYWAAIENDTPILSSYTNSGLALSNVKKLVDTSWYSVDATSYVIDSVEDLYGFWLLSQSDSFKGKTIKLGKDLVVNEGSAKEWATTAPARTWVSISNKTVPFAGTFDGQGHTISGIYQKTSDENAGLFGVTATDSVVKNFKLVNSYFCGETKTTTFAGLGSIIGQIRGTLSNVYSNAIIESNGVNIGGLVGSASGVKVNGKPTTITISNCWFDGEVNLKEQGGRYGGGIVGVAIQGNVNFEHCLFSGVVSSEAVNTGLHIGGILGADINVVNVNMTDCLSSGKMDVDYHVAVGSVIGRTTLKNSSFSMNQVYTSEECYKNAGGVATAVGLISGKAIDGSAILLPESRLTGISAYQFTELDFANYWVAVTNDTPALKNYAESAADLTNVAKKVETDWYSADAKTMVIDSVEDLYGFWLLSQTTNFKNQTILLGDDLVVNEGVAKEWRTKAPENIWLPISSKALPFAGTFDGQGHEISGIYVSSANEYNGLFAMTDTKSVLKNFQLTNSYFACSASGNAYANMGSIAGEVRGSLYQVYSDAILDSTAQIVGGLAGRGNAVPVNGKASMVTVAECWFAGEVNLKGQYAQHGGGVFGAVIQGNIRLRDSLFTGYVSCERVGVTQHIGGFVGGEYNVVNMKMLDCLSAGTVSATHHLCAASVHGRITLADSNYKISDVYATRECYSDGQGNYYSIVNTSGVSPHGRVTLINNADVLGFAGQGTLDFDFTETWVSVANHAPIPRCFAGTVVEQKNIIECDTSWYDGSGTYEIDTAGELYGFMVLAKDGETFAGDTIQLKHDIELNEVDETILAEWEAGTKVPNIQWTPIGTSGAKFAGHFNGNGYTISGLYVKDTSTSDTYTGMFGITEKGSTIQNFQLVDSYFERTGSSSGYAFMGSIAGEHRGNISNVYSNAILKTDGQHVGGLIGRANGVEATTIKMDTCWFEGQIKLVNNGGYAGGLIGMAVQGTIEVKDSMFTGKITSQKNSAAYIGGILATEMNYNMAIRISNCIVAGEVETKTAILVGALVARISLGTTQYSATNTYYTSEGYKLNDVVTNAPAAVYLKAITITQDATKVSKSDLIGEVDTTAIALNFTNTYVTRKEKVPALQRFVGKIVSADELTTSITASSFARFASARTLTSAANSNTASLTSVLPEDTETKYEKIQLSTVATSSQHSYWIDDHLINGVTAGSSFWSTGDDVKASATTVTATVTLAETTNVSYIELYPRTGNQCFPQNFDVQVSSDGTTWSSVIRYAGYTHTDDTKPLKIMIDRGNVKYVKLNIQKNANDYIQVAEFQAFSQTPWDVAKDSLQEVAISNTISTSSHSYWGKSYLTDGAIGGTLWSSGDDVKSLATTVTNTFTLAETTNVHYVDIYPRKNNELFPNNFTVSVSGDGSTWTEVAKYVNYTHTDDWAPLRVLVNRDNIKFVKIDIAKSASVQYVQFAEVKVWSLPSGLKQLKLSAVETKTTNSYWTRDWLINGVLTDMWSSDEYSSASVDEWAKVKLEEKQNVHYVDLYPRTAQGVYTFPNDFEVSVSEDGNTWTTVATYKDYTHPTTSQPLRVLVNKDNIQYIKVNFTKIPAVQNRYYVQLGEIMVYDQNIMTAAEAAEVLTIADPGVGETSIKIGNISGQFVTEIVSTTPSGIIANNGTFISPSEDTEVTVTIKVTNTFDTTDTANTTRKVLVHNMEDLEAQQVADKVDFISCPAADATKITLPTVDGYTVTIAKSSHPQIVDTNGNIMRSNDTTYGVRLTLRLTNNTTGGAGLTDALLVPIYKTYVKPTMTETEIEAAHEDYESKSYGIFVHYVSQLSKYADGATTLSVDEIAENFDAAQFAKDMNDFGVEYVMLTGWHANTITLFPSMTNQRWRDDRRAEGSTGVKSYSERDVLGDLLDELDKYGIDLYLYTHPSDGHDFTTEDQALTGWNDSTGNYATWNDYINELYYEVCERYGDRIKCLWFDGVYNHVRGEENQQRLRETCLTFNPGMILTMNVGFEEGNLNPQPSYTHPDYRCWEVNRYVDFTNDMKFSRYQSAIVLASKGWWTTVGQNVKSQVQPAEDMFQYLVAMSSISTHGGFAASTGFYPARDTDNLNGDYWMYGIRDTLLKVNSYLEPVEESIKNTSVGKAYPTTENLTVDDLEWGVSTESRDGKHIYLHVLNAPIGNTLTLPETSDGTVLSNTGVIMNFDGTTTPISIVKTDTGYSITLPENAHWSMVDTVIKVARATAPEGDGSIDGENTTTTPSTGDKNTDTTPTPNKETENQSNTSAKTGDSNKFGLWIMLLAVAVVGIVGGLVGYRKKH